MIKRLFLPVLTLSLSACTIAPLTTPNGGTTLGKGKQEISANLLPAPSASVVVGVRDNTDVGATIEEQLSFNYSVWLKHSVANNAQGASAAGLAGVFKSGDGSHSQGFYLGPSFSYATGKTEFYSTLRYNRVYWDGIGSLTSSEKDDVWSIFEISDQVFYYWQMDAGIHLNTSDTFRISFGATCISLDGDSNCTPMAGVGFKL